MLNKFMPNTILRKYENIYDSEHEMALSYRVKSHGEKQQ